MTALAYSWACYDCGANGTGDGSNRAADKHGKATGHTTRVWGVPG